MKELTYFPNCLKFLFSGYLLKIVYNDHLLLSSIIFAPGCEEVDEFLVEDSQVVHNHQQQFPHTECQVPQIVFHHLRLGILGTSPVFERYIVLFR